MIAGRKSIRKGTQPGTAIGCLERPAAGIRAAFTLIVAAVFVTGMASGQDGLALPDNPFAGRPLIESKHCLLCHGIADSGASVGPSLGAGGFAGSFLDLGAAMWNHVPVMGLLMESAGLEWPELSAIEVTQVIAFLYSIDYLGRPGSAGAGERLFVTLGCTSCHTIGGGDDVGPDLADLNRFASPISVAQGIWNHGPSMLESLGARGLSPPRFAEGDLADLSAFIRQRTGQGSTDRLLLEPGNPNRGHELFSAKGCSRCHGRDGNGGESGPGLRGADLHRSAEWIAASMWNHSLGMRDTMRQLGLGWPQLDSSEMADLVAYLYFLPFTDARGDAQRGARVFEERACASCHAIGSEATEAVDTTGPSLEDALGKIPPPAFVSILWNHASVMRDVIIGEGRPWPELSGADLRDLRAFLQAQATEP